jgi:ABC-2 type transport system permease protein
VRRELWILKRLRATPLSAATYIAAMLASTLIVFVLQVIALFLIGRVLHGTPFPAAAGSLALAIVIGAVVFAALGVATASLIRSSEGSSAVVNFILLPMAFLSGAFGPTLHYPSFLRAIGDVLPLKYFIDIVDAVYLRGHSIWTKGPALAVLAAWGVTGLVVAALKFRWEPREG